METAARTDFSWERWRLAGVLQRSRRRDASAPRLFHRRPDAVNVVVVVERLQKFAHLGALRVGEFGKIFRHITEFTRHNRPAV